MRAGISVHCHPIHLLQLQGELVLDEVSVRVVLVVVEAVVQVPEAVVQVSRREQVPEQAQLQLEQALQLQLEQAQQQAPIKSPPTCAGTVVESVIRPAAWSVFSASILVRDAMVTRANLSWM